MNSEFLEQVLKYHKTLVSAEFIERLMAKIDRTYKLRQWILSVCLLAGFSFGIAGLLLLFSSHWMTIEYYLSSLTTLVSTVVVSLLIVFFFWLFNDEFERP